MRDLGFFRGGLDGFPSTPVRIPSNPVRKNNRPAQWTTTEYRLCRGRTNSDDAPSPSSLRAPWPFMNRTVYLLPRNQQLYCSHSPLVHNSDNSNCTLGTQAPLAAPAVQDKSVRNPMQQDSGSFGNGYCLEKTLARTEQPS